MPVYQQQASHQLSDGWVELLGAVSQVTGAMTLVQFGEYRLLVDCGRPQGDGAAGWSLPELANKADCVVLTHAHYDHVGALPDLIDAGFSGPIYATGATLQICRILLEDSMRLQRVSSEQRRALLSRFEKQQSAVPYARSLDLENGVSICLHEAGHILGSASVEICSEKSRVLISGDLGRPGSPILRDYNTSWSDKPPVDLLLLESTYGDRLHAVGAEDVEASLERIIKRALRDGGHILVPAFAIGRTQALLYHLNTLVESRRIKELPIAIDTPMGLKVLDEYNQARCLFDRESLEKMQRGDDPLDFMQLFSVWRGQDSKRLSTVETPMLIIAGSGMCTGGRIVTHLETMLERPETCVLFTGYQAKGTLGREIQKAANSDGSVAIGGQRVEVRAEVQTLTGLSAHADQSELLAWVAALPRVDNIALFHGEPLAQEALAKRLPMEEAVLS